MRTTTAPFVLLPIICVALLLAAVLLGNSSSLSANPDGDASSCSENAFQQPPAQPDKDSDLSITTYWALSIARIASRNVIRNPDSCTAVEPVGKSSKSFSWKLFKNSRKIHRRTPRGEGPTKLKVSLFPLSARKRSLTRARATLKIQKIQSANEYFGARKDSLWLILAKLIGIPISLALVLYLWPKDVRLPSTQLVTTHQHPKDEDQREQRRSNGTRWGSSPHVEGSAGGAARQELVVEQEGCVSCRMAKLYHRLFLKQAQGAGDSTQNAGVTEAVQESLRQLLGGGRSEDLAPESQDVGGMLAQYWQARAQEWQRQCRCQGQHQELASGGAGTHLHAGQHHSSVLVESRSSNARCSPGEGDGARELNARTEGAACKSFQPTEDQGDADCSLSEGSLSHFIGGTPNDREGEGLSEAVRDKVVAFPSASHGSDAALEGVPEAGPHPVTEPASSEAQSSRDRETEEGSLLLNLNLHLNRSQAPTLCTLSSPVALEQPGSPFPSTVTDPVGLSASGCQDGEDEEESSCEHAQLSAPAAHFDIQRRVSAGSDMRIVLRRMSELQEPRHEEGVEGGAGDAGELGLRSGQAEEPQAREAGAPMPSQGIASRAFEVFMSIPKERNSDCGQWDWEKGIEAEDAVEREERKADALVRLYNISLPQLPEHPYQFWTCCDRCYRTYGCLHDLAMRGFPTRDTNVSVLLQRSFLPRNKLPLESWLSCGRLVKGWRDAGVSNGAPMSVRRCYPSPCDVQLDPWDQVLRPLIVCALAVVEYDLQRSLDILEFWRWDLDEGEPALCGFGGEAGVDEGPDGPVLLQAGPVEELRRALAKGLNHVPKGNRALLGNCTPQVLETMQECDGTCNGLEGGEACTANREAPSRRETACQVSYGAARKAHFEELFRVYGVLVRLLAGIPENVRVHWNGGRILSLTSLTVVVALEKEVAIGGGCGEQVAMPVQHWAVSLDTIGGDLLSEEHWSMMKPDDMAVPHPKEDPCVMQELKMWPVVPWVKGREGFVPSHPSAACNGSV